MLWVVCLPHRGSRAPSSRGPRSFTLYSPPTEGARCSAHQTLVLSQRLLVSHIHYFFFLIAAQMFTIFLFLLGVFSIFKLLLEVLLHIFRIIFLAIDKKYITNSTI